MTCVSIWVPQMHVAILLSKYRICETRCIFIARNDLSNRKLGLFLWQLPLCDLLPDHYHGILVANDRAYVPDDHDAVSRIGM